jgi:hypothetical protein
MFRILLPLLLISFPASSFDVIPPPAREVASQFRLDRLRADLEFLSSDLLEGRGTGARGGEIAAAYIASQFAIAGLKPMGDEGTYFQKLPLIGLKTDPGRTLQVTPAGRQPFSLRYLDEFVANALTLKEEERIDAPVVFAGYGITASEFGWDDYAGVDVRGKIVVAMVNDPADPQLFAGPAMTY